MRILKRGRCAEASTACGMVLQLRLITDTVTLMTKTDNFRHVLSTYARQSDSFGWESAEFQLDIWEDDGNKLHIRIMKDGVKVAEATFRDCETQHHDTERWVNDKVGFPNPFAGFMLNRSWEC